MYSKDMCSLLYSTDSDIPSSGPKFPKLPPGQVTKFRLGVKLPPPNLPGPATRAPRPGPGLRLENSESDVKKYQPEWSSVCKLCHL
jgi:hypothetical protein